MLTPEEHAGLRESWTEDCRKIVPAFELYDDDRMFAEIDRIRLKNKLTCQSDLMIVMMVIRSLKEDQTRVPGPWWWIAACLEILPDLEATPWFEMLWWCYDDMRGKMEMLTVWGSASTSKSTFFAACALTNMVVWHGEAFVYITSPYKVAGADKIWANLSLRADQWQKDPPAWAHDAGLTIVSNRDEITISNTDSAVSTAKFVALETTASIQGKKRSRTVGTKSNPRRGVVMLVGDEIILNPAACLNLTQGEGNLVANDNVMSFVGCNPAPHQVRHPNALDLSAPTEVSTDALNEHVHYTWRTLRGRLVRLCMGNSPNRFRREPVFDYLIHESQAEAATRRGVANYQAQVAAWGWSEGMGNGGVLSLDAIRTPAWQNSPTWASPPERWLFVDLAFGGTDPAGYTCLEGGMAHVDGQERYVVSGIEQEKIHVERKWTPTQEEIDEFKRLAAARGGTAPKLVAGEETVGANALMVFQMLRVAARLGIGRGRVSFDSSMRPDVTLLALSALGSVPWFYSGTRPLKEDDVMWPLYPPQRNPDGTVVRWSDNHQETISAAWRFAEHLVSEGHVWGLKNLRKGTSELISRAWVQRSANKTDVAGKKTLASSPLWAETFALGLTFGVRFCGALPRLGERKPLFDGAAVDFTTHPAFQIKPRRLRPIWKSA